MAGAVLERELTGTRAGRIEFDVASNTDDLEIRRLLRENPMAGRISVSLEREPNYFADANISGETHQTIVAREGERVVCVGQCSIRQRFVNGIPRRVGYLGGLRLDARHAGRFDIVRRGYEFFREIQTSAPADIYFTSIAADNERARRFLEAGIRGMPIYEFMGEFVTLIISCSGRRIKRGSNPINRDLSNSSTTTQWLDFLNDYNRSREFAPCWSEQQLVALKALGLQSSDFFTVSNGQQIVAGGALWDQRSFKQTVIRGYAPTLSQARPLLNMLAPILRQPRLPAIGETLATAFVSHFAVSTSESKAAVELLDQLCLDATQRGIELLTMGFAANDPLLKLIRKNFRCREYLSRIYTVRWPELGGTACNKSEQILAPEVALL